MKKLFLVGALALFGATTMNAQESGFKIGAHAGLPMGDASDISSFTAGVDVAYVWGMGDNFEVGLTTGYSHFFGKDISTPAIDLGFGAVVPAMSYKINYGIIPIAATAQYNFDGGFNIGADLGYGMFTGDAEDGGFYYQPKIGYNVGEAGNVYIGYKGVSQDGANISSLNLGYTHKF